MKPFETLENEEPNSTQDEVARLTKLLSDEHDGRLEERFIWIMALIIIIDAWWFSNMPSWGGSVSILILELLLLMMLGRRCQVEDVAQIVDRLLEGWSPKNS